MQTIYKVTENPYSDREWQEVKYVSRKGLASFYYDHLEPVEGWHIVVDDVDNDYQEVADYDEFYDLVREKKKIVFAHEDEDGELYQDIYSDGHYQVEVVRAEDKY